MERVIKLKFIEDFGTPHAKTFDLTADGIMDCMRENGDVDAYTVTEYFDRILTGGFPNIKRIQFTGLLDKNGKEIYEGDIVKDCSHSDMVFEVKFNTEKGGYFMPDGFDVKYYWPMADVELEVIGNIYENPDLIK